MNFMITKWNQHMKRAFLIFITTLICAIASAQIQRKFFGLEMNKVYTFPNNAASIIKERFLQVEVVDENTIAARSGKFGGYNWDWAKFEFHISMLYDISFLFQTRTKEDVQTRFDSLVDDLTRKYGESLGDEKFRVWHEKGGSLICTLIISQSEDQDWNLMLRYVDTYIEELENKKNKDEL